MKPLRPKFWLKIAAFCLPNWLVASALLPGSPAISVSRAYLFPDTSLSASTTEFVDEGTLLDILAQSATEQLDKDQNQLFHWFFVKTPDGRRGWLFGDGVARLQSAENLPENLRPLHRKSVALGRGFEDALLWFAALEGHDAKEYHLSFYGEYYLVATNAQGRCAFLRYATTSAAGETRLRQLFFKDFNADGHSDFALETSRRDLEGNPDSYRDETRSLDIFSLQNSQFKRIFSEDLTLLDPDGLPAPSRFKCVDLEAKTIRVEYLEYLACDRAAQPTNAPPLSSAQEQCVQFVTYTYSWNVRAGAFQLLYEPTRVPPTVAPLNFGVSVRKIPALAGEVVGIFGTDDRLAVFRQFDKIVVENGQKKVEPYLLVRTPDGQFGFIAASKIQWLKTRHARLLEAYGQQPPLSRVGWSADLPFVRLLGGGGPVGSGN